MANGEVSPPAIRPVGPSQSTAGRTGGWARSHMGFIIASLAILGIGGFVLYKYEKNKSANAAGTTTSTDYLTPTESTELQNIQSTTTNEASAIDQLYGAFMTDNGSGAGNNPTPVVSVKVGSGYNDKVPGFTGPLNGQQIAWLKQNKKVLFYEPVMDQMVDIAGKKLLPGTPEFAANASLKGETAAPGNTAGTQQAAISNQATSALSQQNAGVAAAQASMPNTTAAVIPGANSVIGSNGTITPANPTIAKTSGMSLPKSPTPIVAAAINPDTGALHTQTVDGHTQVSTPDTKQTKKAKPAKGAANHATVKSGPGVQGSGLKNSGL